MELGVPRSTVQKILKVDNFHPYKTQVLQKLSEDDPDHRMEMCAWFLDRLDNNACFTEDCVLFSNEANFYVNREVKKHNVVLVARQSALDLPYQTTRSSEGVDVVWCGLWRAHVFHPSIGTILCAER